MAGKQRGLDEGSGTRSSLLWECERVIRVARPKYLLLENVKNLIGKKHKHNFDEWLKILEGYGYKNYWQVLNAKDYGIPQNRERVFVVSIRNDIDCDFEFPKPITLEKHLKDMLENQVDEKFYLSKEMQDRFVYRPKGENIIGTSSPDAKIGQRNLVYDSNKVMGCLTATDYKGPKQILEIVGRLDLKGYHDLEKKVYSPEGCSPTIDAKGNRSKFMVKNDKSSKTFVFNGESCRIRKLTPKECWRLMGFKDEQFDKAEKVCSNTQLYKQAGNLIVVNVLEEIFKQMFLKEDENEG